MDKYKRHASSDLIDHSKVIQQFKFLQDDGKFVKESDFEDYLTLSLLSHVSFEKSPQLKTKKQKPGDIQRKNDDHNR